LRSQDLKKILLFKLVIDILKLRIGVGLGVRFGPKDRGGHRILA